MTPNPLVGTVAVPVSIKPAAQCQAGWPAVFHAAGWRMFAKRCQEPGACGCEWLLKHHEHVFAFRQFDGQACAQQLQLPEGAAAQLLRLFAKAGIVQERPMVAH
jgi:hypothetical protein